MADRRQRSEFAGQDGPSGLPLWKPHSALTASEKLRLVYTTGTENPLAPLDRRAFLGGGIIDPRTQIPPSRIPPVQ